MGDKRITKWIEKIAAKKAYIKIEIKGVDTIFRKSFKNYLFYDRAWFKIDYMFQLSAMHYLFKLYLHHL